VNKIRVKLFFIIFAITIITIFASSMIPVDRKSANVTQTDVNSKVDNMKASGSLTQFIFGNNLIICIVMLLPFAGPGFGLFALYNTGRVIGAEAVAQSMNPIAMNIYLFSTPVFWIEFFAYTIAITESMIFTYYCLTHRFRNELPKYAITLSICAVALFLGAVIETLIISGNTLESYILFVVFMCGLITFKLILMRRDLKRMIKAEQLDAIIT
jgi:hypothetical protein